MLRYKNGRYQVAIDFLAKLATLSFEDYTAVLKRVKILHEELEFQASQTIPPHNPLSDLPPTFLSFQSQDLQEAEPYAELEVQSGQLPSPIEQHLGQRAVPLLLWIMLFKPISRANWDLLPFPW